MFKWGAIFSSYVQTEQIQIKQIQFVIVFTYLLSGSNGELMRLRSAHACHAYYVQPSELDGMVVCIGEGFQTMLPQMQEAINLQTCNMNKGRAIVTMEQLVLCSVHFAPFPLLPPR